MNTKNVEEGKSGIKGVNELTKAFEAMFADGVTAGGNKKKKVVKINFCWQ